MFSILHDTLPTASVALLNYILAELGPDEPYPYMGNTGLPAGMELADAALILLATPVTAPFYDEALMRCAEHRKRDMILVRHGFYPEILDPVSIDVVLRSSTGPIFVPDLIFFRDQDGGLHLVSSRADLCVAVRRHGLAVSMPAPWSNGWERVAGLERAAAEIVRACRPKQAG